jgi:peptide/nickel transport system substrate-binding protein
MRSKKSLALASLVLALALFGAACASQDTNTNPSTDNGASDAAQGGTLVVAAEQFPADTMCYGATNNIAWCYYPENAVLLGAYRQTPQFTYEPELLDGEAEISEGPPFKVTYHIAQDAVWSDGTPVTADDFEYTKDAILDPNNEPVGTDGYDDIQSTKIIDDKTYEVTFKKPFAPYKTLFGPLYPAHILKGQDWDKVWDKCICDPKTGDPVGDGPFLLTSWKKNQEWVLERNDKWWGPHPAYLDKMVWRYIADVNSQIQALRGGEVDMIYPTTQLTLKNVLTMPNITSDIGSGTFYQHLDFQTKNPLLKNDWVRQAIAYGIDRQAIVDKLVKPIQDDAEILQNMMYVTNAPEYEPHYDIYNFDPQKAASLLEDHGCKKGSDGIYVCGGEKMSFSYKSTADNELRELMYQIIQAELKDVGIEMRNDFGEADVVFTELSQHDFDVFQFGWVGNVDPFGNNALFQCGADQNYGDFCVPAADKFMEQANTLLDPTARAAAYNSADAELAKTVPVLPLWQAPQMLAYSDKFGGFENNTTTQGPIWNAADIYMKK